jgi:hypothetical protein
LLLRLYESTGSCISLALGSVPEMVKPWGQFGWIPADPGLGARDPISLAHYYVFSRELLLLLLATFLHTNLTISLFLYFCPFLVLQVCT